ncbi:MAG TPA: sugar ABC transporter permease [Streptosporangiaceae bacterium]|jgi:raffinose/stachyose/melibiose transport system permease protein
MVLPTLAFFTVFVVIPIVYSLYYSLTNFVGFGAAKFTGFANYLTLFHDPLFWTSLRNTLIILVLSVVVLIPLSFLLAMLMRRPFRGARFLRALVFAPGIIAPILVGLIWVFILDPKIGLIDKALFGLGVGHPPVWIGGNTLGPFSIAIVFIWSTIGFAMTIFYAGLQLLPPDVMEASSLDGASAAQQTWYVTIPMLKETFAITTVLVISNVFKIFELVYQLTGGGPVHKSETLVSYMYFITFTSQEYGPGMAFAVIITALGAVVSLGYLVLLRGRRGVPA